MLRAITLGLLAVGLLGTPAVATANGGQVPPALVSPQRDGITHKVLRKIASLHAASLKKPIQSGDSNP